MKGKMTKFTSVDIQNYRIPIKYTDLTIHGARGLADKENLIIYIDENIDCEELYQWTLAHEMFHIMARIVGADQFLSEGEEEILAENVGKMFAKNFRLD